MSPLDLQDILERAKGSARVGDHETAERLLKTYIAKKPDDRDVRLLLGTTLAKAGKLDEAKDEFTSILSIDPFDVEPLNNLAVIYRRQDKLLDALDALQRAIDIDPNRAEFYYNLGNTYKHLSNDKAAIMAYAKVVELDPNYVSAYNNLGTIYEKLKEYPKAFNMFKKGLSLDRNNPMLHFNYGVSLEANGHLEEASEEYNAAIRSRPGWIEAMNNLGIVQFKQGRHAKARETFNHVLDIDPFNAEARNNIGVVYADQGRTNEAIQNYRQAIESDPQYVKAVINLERSLEASGNFAEALVELEKLVKLVPDSTDIRNKLASLYLKMERYPEAEEQVKAALEREPENIQSLRISGIVHRLMGNDEEARKIFEHILDIDPNNNFFLLDLADIYFKRKDFKEAEERILTFLSRKPNDRNAKLMLGKLYAEMGNETHALQIFDELAASDPTDTEALAASAELHKKTGELEKALRTADKLVNLQGRRATPDDLSDLNDSLSFYENAVNDYSASVREMWERNLQLLRDSTSEQEEDISLLMDSIEINPESDEESEELLMEDDENSDKEDTFYDEEFFKEEEEEAKSLLDEKEKKSLDNLAENDEEAVPDPSQDNAKPAVETESPRAALPEEEDYDDDEPEIKPKKPKAHVPKAKKPRPSLPKEKAPVEAEEDEIDLDEEEPSADPEPADEKIVRENREILETIIIQKTKKITPKDMVGLIVYLQSLVRSLPHEAQQDFKESDTRLSMEFIIDTLEDRKGLFRGITEKLSEKEKAVIDDASAPHQEQVLGTLSYLASLASGLPDSGLGTAIQRKVDTVVSELQQTISLKEGDDHS